MSHRGPTSRASLLIVRSVRLLVWALMHTLYRMTVVGRSSVPSAGGALLVCNATSYIDHALVLASLSRPVRFFMGRQFYEHRMLYPLARAVNAIPISPSDSPKTIVQALSAARDAIQAGELVCIFAEGNITHTGNMLPFGRGFEFIMRGLDAPIIPMHLDRIWGSTFSIVDQRIQWHLPKVIPYPVTVSFGAPLPARSTAPQVRLAVQELSADAFRLRGASQKKLHCAFIDEAKRHPFSFCMADSLGMRFSRGKALAAVFALAEGLFPRSTSLPDAEKVGILLPTSCAAALVNVAVLCAGKIPVNLNYTSSKEMIDSCAGQCDMRMTITSRAFLDKVALAPRDGVVFMEDVRAKIGACRSILCLWAVLMLPACVLKRLFVRGGSGSIDDIATIIFSSGSTGEPKGVMLTHQNIMSNVEGSYQVFNFKRADVVMAVLPFFHSFGYTANLWLPLIAGVTVVFHPNPLDAPGIGEMSERYNATIIMGTPSFLSAYQRRCSRRHFSSLRFAVAGAEKLKRAIAQDFHQSFGVPVFEGYGCTELSPIVSLGIPSYIHPAGKFVQVGNKPGTVGHPIPGVAACIVDQHDFSPLPAGSQGLLLIKGPNVMRGYLNDPARTAAVIRKGWYVTGDIATIDDDGFIAITDRLNRFSKIAGEMVPHVRIEEMVHEIVGAAEQICVVTSAPDERKGECLVVLYCIDLSVAAIRESLLSRGMPSLWVPKSSHFFRISQIPMLGGGKLDLQKARQIAHQFIGKVSE